jgi:hypothetical protein
MKNLLNQLKEINTDGLKYLHNETVATSSLANRIELTEEIGWDTETLNLLSGDELQKVTTTEKKYYTWLNGYFKLLNDDEARIIMLANLNETTLKFLYGNELNYLKELVKVATEEF